MNPFKGCVVVSELSKKADVSDGLFRQLKNIEFRAMGGLTTMVKDSLPTNYRDIAEKECLDLENYWGFAYASREIGMSKDYFTVASYTKDIEMKKIGGVRLVKLTKEFKENIEKGLTPIKIKSKDDLNHTKEVIDMYGIKIGFY